MKIPALFSHHLVRLSLIGLVFAVGLTLGSVGVQRDGPERVVVANGCGAAGDEPCYESLRNGGFPLGFVFDKPTVRVPYKLGLEDDLRPLPFLADVAGFWAVLAASWAIGLVRRRNISGLMRSRRRAP